MSELTVADYEAALADHQRLVRELDVLLNGDAAAPQASLCDIVAQLRREVEAGILGRLVVMPGAELSDCDL